MALSAAISTQVGSEPPTVVMFVNNLESVDAAYQRFIIHQLRDLLALPFVFPLVVVDRVLATGQQLPDGLWADVLEAVLRAVAPLLGAA